jgi:hypothetical protein
MRRGASDLKMSACYLSLSSSPSSLFFFLPVPLLYYICTTTQQCQGIILCYFALLLLYYYSLALFLPPFALMPAIASFRYGLHYQLFSKLIANS